MSSKPNLAQRVDLALQITLHPRDAAVAAHSLPRQLESWADLVDRVLITVDSRPTIDCRGAAFRAARKDLFVLLEGLRPRYRDLGIDSVVYASHFRDKIDAAFFGGRADWPDYAADGSPFYASFFGLMRTNGRRVLHLAPGALHRGDHAGFLAAALACLSGDEGVCGVAPTVADLPGRVGWGASLVLDMERLTGAVAPLAPVVPGAVERLRALVLAREATSRPAFAVIAQGAAQAGLGLVADAGGQLSALPAGGASAKRAPGLGARLRAGADMLVGAQLKRLGRI